ncbi:VOC family protein [Parapedobacter deserti]|uniref:VOC family protein n=1 Tax=Parapedobacter deserti TaxID=1912957 RepID=A0ABV7JM78_9SPHI
MKRKIARYLLGSICLIGTTMKANSQEKKALFNHVALSVYDLEKSASFYQDVLQLDTIPEPFKIGKHKWFEIAPGLSLHLIRDAAEIREHNRSTHLCFSVVSIDDFIARLKKFGVDYYNVQHELGKVGTRVDGVKQLYIKDPDGYWIEVNDERRY